MYLGNAGTHSGSSAAVAQTENGTRTQWLLSSVEDGVSNRIDYQYQVVSGSQTLRIDSIKYGAHTGDALSHYITVAFDYEDLGYPVKGFSAGEAFDLSTQLNRVRVLIDG